MQSKVVQWTFLYTYQYDFREESKSLFSKKYVYLISDRIEFFRVLCGSLGLPPKYQPENK